MSKQMSTSPAASQPGLIDSMVKMDPLESMLDFSDYDNYQSPSLSPVTTSKASFARPTTAASTPASLLPSSQQMSGPSHQYDLYKQQTGIPAGALASTLAINQNNTQISGYNSFNIDFLGLNGSDEIFDFNTNPSQASVGASEMDMDFESSPADASFFFPETTVNPSSIGGQEPSSAIPSPRVLSSQGGNMGRLWPGMHQQAALAKAQAQQRQQQQIIQQQQAAQRQAAQQQQQAKQLQHQQHQQQQRIKGAQPTDPLVEQKITQLLNSMRAKSLAGDGSQNVAPLHNAPRAKKDEDDMDDDEKLLASEEGKKLSSKERRQLRNKVSARAFRSRRKEYITQLEAEISGGITENGELRAQNRALVEENKRLTDLTRMLLSSPSFSDFLDRLSTNPQQPPQTQSAPQQQQQQQQDARQLPKDINPYTVQQQLQHQQIGMAMIPEQSMDLSMLSLDSSDAFSFQPQVYAVLETPEPPASIDTSILSGKTSNFVGEHFGSDEKVDMPIIERPVPVERNEAPSATPAVVDEEFENDPLFALYHAAPESQEEAAAAEPDLTAISHVEIFGGIESEKALARFELVDASEDEASVAMAMDHVQRISASLESLTASLELLTAEL